MQINIVNKQGILGQDASLKTESKVAAALSKFGQNILNVEVTITDVNGPRGGIDKECRVKVKLRKRGVVIASERHHSLSRAIGRSIGRAERSIARKVLPRLYRGTDRRDFGLASANG